MPRSLHTVTAGPLQGLDLSVAPGLTVVTGPPGGGGSTLLRLLAGTQQPERGRVTGEPGALLEQPPGHEWTDATEVPVMPALADHLTGRAYWTLSGGERQRARVGTLLLRPEPLLLLDEPLGYLDDRGVAQVLSALHEQSLHRPVVVRCASDPRAADAADRVLVLDDGHLTEQA